MITQEKIGIRASNLSYQHPDGEWQFQNLNLIAHQGFYGLVGNNGCGKSLLCDLLMSVRQPTSGQIELSGEVAHLVQLHEEYQPSELASDNLSISDDLSISDFLGITPVLEAITRIEQGSIDANDFETVGDNWDIRERLETELEAMGVCCHLAQRITSLSGGELTRLKLWQLFESNPDVLILDEPSNHLDQKGKQWLIDRLRQFSGCVLVVSHDRQLLRYADGIFELSHLGLNHYSGNYDAYHQTKAVEQAAIARKLEHIEKQQKQVARKAQEDHEKAQKRAAQGNRLRKSGSQSKLILDGAKQSAEKSASAKQNMHERRKQTLTDTYQSLSQLKAQQHSMSLSFENHSQKQRQLVFLENCILPFGSDAPVTWSVHSGDKWHISGKNGKGKSTLLKCLSGELSFSLGSSNLKECLYIDQHFSLLGNELPMIDVVKAHLEHLNDSEIRNLLAAIGFRRDSVFRCCQKLSGGEKMKLSVLIASHQAQPCLLLLDEPDNHLDIASKQLLANMLAGYQSGFILVSHDPVFVEESGVQYTFQI